MSHLPRIPEMETSRLRLRRQTIEDAPVFRHLWTERDERVPAHRRLDTDGRPDTDDIRAHIQGTEASSLLTVERIDTGEPIGYCGLVYGGEGVGEEPELAFELLRAEHNRGYATEAAQSVLAWAAGVGVDRVWAGVWEWNLPSRRVLEKLGFVESGRERPSSVHGRNILTVRTLSQSSRAEGRVAAVPDGVIVSGTLPDDVDRCVQLWVRALLARDGEVDSHAVGERTRGVFGRPLIRFAIVDHPFSGFAVTVGKVGEPMTAVLERIAVAPGKTGQGIGRALLTDAIDSSRRRGRSAMELAVRRGNPAVRLYEALGFRATSGPADHPLGGEPMITFRRSL